MIRTQEEHLAHYGILRRSGRYPWGSGNSESTRNRSFLDEVAKLRKDGLSDAKIAEGFGISRNELTAARTIALAQQKQEKILTAQRLREKGWSHEKIAQRMGLPGESSVRALLAPGAKDKSDALFTTSNIIKKHVDEKKYIQIGKGVNLDLGVTRDHFNTAVAILKEQGYQEHNIHILQAGTGKYTTLKTLSKPGTTLQEVQRNRAQIRLIDEHSEDHGRSFDGGIQPPISVSSRRITVTYGKDGAKADGVIYIRPGVKDLSIGSKRYAQVRVAVDGTHYLKGMAVYKEDLPDGVDIVFNTNKSDTGRKKDAMKELANDPEFPFGAIVHQIKGPDRKVTSAMNLVNEEGSWDKWSRNLSSQMLSKQSPKLAQQQLNQTFERRTKELKEINSLTNPTVRKELLLKFGDSTDSAAVHLKAANLPRQATKVILPINSIKPGEVFAPSMRDGEIVALVRFPHGGPFEIPQLIVNNRNREARKILGTDAQDAIGIHHTVAKRLSGADFDGDTVLVIPNNRKQIESAPALEGLKNFDPQVYKVPEGSPIPRIDAQKKGYEMGVISNLITDMTIHGASSEEKARALRHSMVVIDSEKHHLDLVQSAKDNGIRGLKEKYQGGPRAGASTLLSKARAKLFIDQRRPRPASKGGPIDPRTGEKVFEPTGRMIPERRKIVDPITGQKIHVDTGRMKSRKIKTTPLAEAKDAFDLSSGTQMEAIYAEHSNKLKAMANGARKDALRLRPTPYSPSAKRVYAEQVSSLKASLNIAEKNAPRERQAQLITAANVSQRRQSNPNMTESEVKKIREHELTQARIRTGAKKTRIKITQEEWNAIQAGAISTHTLERILNNSDVDTIKALALPKEALKMTSTKLIRARSMLANGYTQAEIADQLDVSLTTLKVGLSE